MDESELQYDWDDEDDWLEQMQADLMVALGCPVVESTQLDSGSATLVERPYE